MKILNFVNHILLIFWDKIFFLLEYPLPEKVLSLRRKIRKHQNALLATVNMSHHYRNYDNANKDEKEDIRKIFCQHFGAMIENLDNIIEEAQTLKSMLYKDK